jgi:TRAP-type C4-dicarboxylate transport system permease small subunit
MTMPRDRNTIARWLRRRANDVIVALMALMFVSFLLQILFRYVFNAPLAWTEEVTVLCWVWVVLWGAALVISNDDEIRFDIVYGIVPEPVRRGFVVVSGVALVVLFLWALPATWGYVMFMKREHSASLGMRFDFLYFVFVIFMVACIARQIRLVWRAIRGEAPPLPGEVTDHEAR